MHALAPAVPEYVPDRQFAHTAEEFAPVRFELLPASQLMHTLALVAPATPEYAPVGQFVHDALPLTFLNVPATQVVQTPPSGPVYPALHLQSEIDFVDVENALIVLEGHDVHVRAAPVMCISET
jgi:hypothetical protein